MLAVVAESAGGPEQLVAADLADPQPGFRQVLIAVHACGVCHFDALNRQGLIARTTFPAILGHEIAGEIVALGEGVYEFAVGDRVTTIQLQPCGHCRPCLEGRENVCRHGSGVLGERAPGGYAELVAIDVNALVRLPDDVGMAAGAILACAVGTAYHAVRTRAHVAVGEHVLITGASGGVGAHAVQIARLAGARVTAVTTSPDKADALSDLGAHDVVVAPDGDFAAELKRLTGGQGVDAVIEIVGAATFASSVRSVRTGGRLVFVGNVTAEDITLAPVLAIMRELEILGAQACTRRELAEVIDLVRRGDVTPLVDRTMPMREAAAAHHLLDARAVSGRIVLVR